jgi:hypothetical protein
MKKMVLFAVVFLAFCGPTHAFDELVSLKIQGMRFYSVKTLNLQPGDGLELVAGGQIKQGNQNEALIIAFSLTKGNHKEIAREVFHIGPKGKTCKTRIRSLVCIKEPSTNRQFIVVNGKAGSEDREVGFIRSYLFNNGFTLIDSIEFSNPRTEYTHGYPLIKTDINGDSRNEIVYGGFSGSKDRDRADIKVFSIGVSGRLSPMKGFNTSRLETLRLRVNALTSGDFNGDGNPEIVAAGRTVEKDEEHAAFVVFSGEAMNWKELTDLGSCRYRYAVATDMTGDGIPELVLGGRINQGDTLYALLDVWKDHKGAMQLISRYRFTGAGSTRLRIVGAIDQLPGRLIIGGRQETLRSNQMKWKGFLQQVIFESGTLAPCSKPVILEKDWETRVRTMDIQGSYLITGGFTEDKNKTSSAFISVYQLK